MGFGRRARIGLESDYWVIQQGEKYEIKLNIVMYSEKYPEDIQLKYENILGYKYSQLLKVDVPFSGLMKNEEESQFNLLVTPISSQKRIEI
jgi:hypothetical protein